MSSTLKVALIGPSPHAEEHLIPSIQLSQALELHTIVSRDQKRALHLAEKYKAHRFATNWLEAVRSPDIDAVIATGPPRFHTEVALAAIEHEKPVFVEKPCAEDLSTLQTLMEAIHRAPDAITQVGYNFRHSDLFLQALEQAGGHRNISLAIIEFHTNKPTQPLWSYSTVLESFLYGVAIHALEMSLWILRAICLPTISVTRIGENSFYISITLTSSAGQTVMLRMSNAWPRFVANYELYTSSGLHISADTNTPNMLGVASIRSTTPHPTDDAYQHSYKKIRRKADDYRGLGYQRQLEAFAKTVTSGAPRVAPIEDSLLTYQLIARILNAPVNARSENLP